MYLCYRKQCCCFECQIVLLPRYDGCDKIDNRGPGTLAVRVAGREAARDGVKLLDSLVATSTENVSVPY